MNSCIFNWFFAATAGALLLGAAPSAGAVETDYSDGILIVNEDWYGHQNSTVNYLIPDDPDGDYWRYRVIQQENPGMELGCTNQYGAIWDGRLYLIAKQEKDPGAKVEGGRISVADAKTLKLIKQLPAIDPSGRQCDGRAFCGVTSKKGYVSTSNGIWVLNLQTLEVEGQIEGSANPNIADDKPATDPGSSLYYGQTGTMILAEGKVFAVHQQYGLLVIDAETDKVVDVLDMSIVDDAVEADTGTRPASGIGSTIVRSKDGNLWYAVARNVQGTGATLPYIVKVNPTTLEREVVRIDGDDVYPPSNSWYAWTPDPICASQVENTIYWCGGSNSWFTNYCVYRFNTATRAIDKVIDFSAEPGDWHIYGCSLGIHPQTDELFASVFHKFVDPTYVTRRYSSGGVLQKEYPMISNYWFPSLPVFPTNPYNKPGYATVAAAAVGGMQVRVVGGTIEVDGCDRFEVYNLAGRLCPSTGLQPGVYIVRTDGQSHKVIVNP